MAKVKSRFHGPACMRRLARLLPDEFWVHRRAARRHRLLSWRSVLDSAIDRLEEPPAGAGATAEPEPVPESFWAHRQAAREEDLLAMRSVVDAFLEWWDALSEEAPPVQAATRIEVE
jgi:hypothetical protein